MTRQSKRLADAGQAVHAASVDRLEKKSMEHAAGNPGVLHRGRKRRRHHVQRRINLFGRDELECQEVVGDTAAARFASLGCPRQVDRADHPFGDQEFLKQHLISPRLN